MIVSKSPDAEKAEVITNYDAKHPDGLSVRVGEIVEIVDKELDSDGWWKVGIINMIYGTGSPTRFAVHFHILYYYCPG